MIVAIVMAVGAPGVYAQPAEAPVTFEVASVKRSPPGNNGPHAVMSGGPGTSNPTRFVTDDVAFLILLMRAYGIQERFQVSELPWMNTERYNIIAKVPLGTTKEQFNLMLQNLLKERFGLKVHRETKEMQTDRLVVARNGHKLKESVPAPPRDPDQSGLVPSGFRGISIGKDGFPELPPGDRSLTVTTAAGAVRRGSRETLEEIAEALSKQFRRPVTDATGLKGRYDYTLKWRPDRVSAGAAGTLPEVEFGPTLPVAIQEQLGLKLEPAKGQVEVLVVDGAEKTPTAN